MNVLKSCAAALLAITSLASIEAARCVPDKALEANEALAGDALDAFFNKRDVSAVDKYIGAEYLQHNPGVKDGPGELKSFIEMFPSDSKFELGTQVAQGDLVWTHGRYTGIPGLNPMIIVDIFRVKDGKLVEHWDIAQEEVTQTASGRPMFPIGA
uniref:SnoaL-like domain-containing protein n=1 Tax=Globisporangium ultimum (strain ATCC 200006 / CBS 805.95 / DAOM BR144) TaxID=431595 RepID=K3WWA8_GLOUD